MKGFLSQGFRDALGNPVNLSVSKVLRDFPFLKIFLSGVQCLPFEERKQKNGPQSSQSCMEAKRTELWSQVHVSSSQAICRSACV